MVCPVRPSVPRETQRICVDVRPSPGKAFRGHLRGSTPTSSSVQRCPPTAVRRCMTRTHRLSGQTAPAKAVSLIYIIHKHSRQTFSLSCAFLAISRSLRTSCKSNIYSQRASLAGSRQQIGNATHASIMPPSNGARKGGEKKNDRALLDSVRCLLLVACLRTLAFSSAASSSRRTPCRV